MDPAFDIIGLALALWVYMRKASLLVVLWAGGCNGGNWVGQPLDASLHDRSDAGEAGDSDAATRPADGSPTRDSTTSDPPSPDLASASPDLASASPDLASASPDLAPTTQPDLASSGDALAGARAHCLARLNEYRAAAGSPALVEDAALDAFSTDAAIELQGAFQYHTYFTRAADNGTLWSSGFCHLAAENQARGGWGATVNDAIDNILAAMMAEGPGGGHHDNILEPAARRVGLGLIISDGSLAAFSNDFSAPCQ